MGQQQTDAEKKQAAELRSRKILHEAVAWAKQKLPNEVTTWVVAAILLERGRLRRDPTVEEVMVRLKAQGRDRATIEKTDPLLLECSTWGEYQQKKARAEQ